MQGAPQEISARRRRRRVEGLALAIAAAFVVLSIAGLALVAAHFGRFHSGWREAVPEAILDFTWLPLIGAAIWLRNCVLDWLNGH